MAHDVFISHSSVDKTTADALCARVQALEHQVYPEAANWFGQGRLEFRDGSAWLDGGKLDDPVVLDYQ